jgi:hypothetical protein
MAISYTCPKCGGSDYFLSSRNVIKGVGGIYGNRGGVKKFPVCKVCDEIMDNNKSISKMKFSARTKTIFISAFGVSLVSLLIPNSTLQFFGIVIQFLGLIGGGLSFFLDRRKKS